MVPPYTRAKTEFMLSDIIHSSMHFRISPKEMALAFFDELEGGIISIIDVVAKFG